MQGWIKLHRQLIDKPIWMCSTLEQRVILITLLCMANHKPKKWEFGGEVYEVQAGQFITSVKSIIEKCNSEEITRQKVRTALKRFESYGFLTTKTTNKNMLVTIQNWAKYQDENYSLTNNLTTEQPTDNHQITTNNNDKNDNIECENVNLSICDTPSLISTIPQTEIDEIDTMFISQFKENINYNGLRSVRKPSEVDNIVNLVYDLVSESNKMIHIGRKAYDKEFLKGILLSLNYEKVDFILDKINDLGKEKPIRNPKRYFQKCIITTAMNYDAEWTEYFNRTYYGNVGEEGD